MSINDLPVLLSTLIILHLRSDLVVLTRPVHPWQLYLLLSRDV